MLICVNSQDGEIHYSYGMESGRGETNKTIEEALKKRKPTGAVWSPDSSRFALVRHDEREVGDLWVVHAVGNERPELESYKYDASLRSRLNSFAYARLRLRVLVTYYYGMDRGLRRYDMPGEDHVMQSELFLYDIPTMTGENAIDLTNSMASVPIRLDSPSPMYDTVCTAMTHHGFALNGRHSRSRARGRVLG